MSIRRILLSLLYNFKQKKNPGFCVFFSSKVKEEFPFKMKFESSGLDCEKQYNAFVSKMLSDEKVVCAIRKPLLKR